MKYRLVHTNHLGQIYSEHGNSCRKDTTAQMEFMFETLDAARQPGSKRIPDLEIGEQGEVILELWCKGGKGQFSVAGNTVIFVPGPFENRDCPPARAQADDDLLAALGEVSTWKRQGDAITLIGPRTLRFHLNTN